MSKVSEEIGYIRDWPSNILLLVIFEKKFVLNNAYIVEEQCADLSLLKIFVICP